MKKLLKRILKICIGMVVVSIMLTAFYFLTAPRETLNLSPVEETVAIKISQFEDNAFKKENLVLTDNSRLKKVIDLFHNARKTRQSSVDDNPDVPVYYKLEIQVQTSNRILYTYKKGRHYYVEEPYQAICQIHKADYEDLAEVYSSGVSGNSVISYTKSETQTRCSVREV